MGIESTYEIEKDKAIKRIEEIVKNIEDTNWVELYNNLNDEEFYKEDFVNMFNDAHKEYIKINSMFKELKNWPIEFVEVLMDKPGFRFSQFENYSVVDNK